MTLRVTRWHSRGQPERQLADPRVIESGDGQSIWHRGVSDNMMDASWRRCGCGDLPANADERCGERTLNIERRTSNVRTSNVNNGQMVGDPAPV